MINPKRYYRHLKETLKHIERLDWFANETHKHGYEIKYLINQLQEKVNSNNNELSQQIDHLQQIIAQPIAQNPEYILSYNPELIPSNELLKLEGVMVMEEWFRWAEEWSWQQLRGAGKKQ
ncbi:hypothetical protein OZ401_002146 [Candidatus Chlorohelix allophototropha]|uniref:Uncharacterized protein n=1 Tax=Candidatus Chlorohelix allophototropha TaxID=3003348 RepID=A0ABY9AZL6_9CHLR|nr:hypothetical protein OZ401_002146 [Chloroflexota bacterium L227-S17]